MKVKQGKSTPPGAIPSAARLGNPGMVHGIASPCVSPFHPGHQLIGESLDKFFDGRAEAGRCTGFRVEWVSASGLDRNRRHHYLSGMASRTKPAWQNTWLWKTLVKRAAARGNEHASELLPTMESWMRRLDTVLAKGGTAPLDFTLHDAGHALRVANRMEDLLSDSVRRNLSDYELALLLLAAYGHDIGMTPERGKVTAHHRHLFHPHESALSTEEIADFQKYLDESAAQPVTLPLGSSLADLNLADELITHYVRERHNDWSAEWLRENLGSTGESFGFLPDAVEILVRLCTSHHLDVRELGNPRFDPFLSTGSRPQLIHLRYLACILRLADILENDPERTPAVLLRHRGIEERERSLVHWQKDHALTIDLRGDRLHFQARPHSAVAHSALLELKEWIDHELHGIASFGERLPAENRVGNDLVRRDWHLAPACTHDIRPADDSYEYIDGAFRPDTGRLLQLLSGEQLYGNPLHAVRELLQNAFDAVREKIARKRLDLPEPADRKWEESLGNQEHVALTLRPGPHGGWELVCEDSGVGLTRDIINNNVLISGTGRRHAIRQLERDCAEKGFRPGLTGQFGIGVLSYFMLAEEVTLETTRYQGCGDCVESWHFATRGVGSFGELKKLSALTFPSGGTRVTWGLRKESLADISAFAQDLLSYLGRTLVRVPCRFDFRIERTPKGSRHWHLDFGWVATEEVWKRRARSQWKNAEEIYKTSSGFAGVEERQRIEESIQRHPERVAEAISRMRCEFHEVLLPDGAGIARFVLTYFEMDEGRSLVFDPEVTGEDKFELQGHSIGAWRGMLCGIQARNIKQHSEIFTTPLAMTRVGVSAEFDLSGAPESTLDVNRDGVLVSSDMTDAWRETVLPIAAERLDAALKGGAGNRFHDINQATRELPMSFDAGAGWFHAAGEPTFREVVFPAAIAFTDAQLGPLRIGDGRPVSILNCHKKHLLHLPRTFELRTIQTKQGGAKSIVRPAILWREAGAAAVDPAFPREWCNVMALSLGANEYFSAVVGIIHHKNPLVGLIEMPHRARLSTSRALNFPFWNVLNAANSPAAAALALGQTALYLASYLLPDITQWTKYQHEQRERISGLWEMIGQELGVDPTTLEFIVSSGHTDVLMSPTGSRLSYVSLGQLSLLPPVTDPDFLIYEVDQEPA